MKIKNQLKKIFSSVFLFSVILISCSAKKGGFELKGKLENSSGQTIYLEQLTMTQSMPPDSVKIDKNGEFVFTPKIPETAFYRLKLADNNFVILILDSTEKVMIHGDAKNLADSYSVDGSKNSKLLCDLNNRLKITAQKADSLKNLYQRGQQMAVNIDSLGQELESKYNSIIEDQKKYIKEFIDKNPASFASLAAIENLDLEKDLDYFVKLENRLMREYPNSMYVKPFSLRVADAMKLAIGQPAPEIVLNSPEDVPLSLSSLKGKIVLIDFWASWCRPCRMENPNVVKLYQKYKDKGFEIYSVSLDKDKNAWTTAIKQDNLTWKHVSDLGFWNSSVVKLYSIQSIPQTYLIDKEGKIIGKGLRGEELAKKLAEIL